MLILGIDPGTATTGYGVIKVNKRNFRILDRGLIETERNGAPEKRLAEIYSQMVTLLRKYKPNVMAIEKIFFATNAKTAIRVGQAQGVIMVTAAKHKVKVTEYAPRTIKKVVTGNGAADKKLVQKSVRKVLGVGVRSRKRKKTHFDNEADALAVAICHALKVNEEKVPDR